MASHPDAKHWSEWTTEELVEKMKGLKMGLEDAANIFSGKGTKGDDLRNLTETRLKEEFRMEEKDMIKVLGFIYYTTGSPKVFMDPVHGLIQIHPLCVKIIDTPQFQRLRFLKQTGAVCFVYPQAVHTRFEHSIGVCHLAGRLARQLQLRQPELDITEKDILCVEIAGLCHDLGHGPFSHLFDTEFMPNMGDRNWTHEEQSVKMFKYMVENQELSYLFRLNGLDTNDIIFIEEQIKGKDKATKVLEEQSAKIFKEMLQEKELTTLIEEFKLTEEDKIFIEGQIKGLEETGQKDENDQKGKEHGGQSARIFRRMIKAKGFATFTAEQKTFIETQIKELEEQSAKIFKMLQKKELTKLIKESNLSEEDKIFIEEQIKGLEETGQKDENDQKEKEDKERQSANIFRYMFQAKELTTLIEKFMRPVTAKIFIEELLQEYWPYGRGKEKLFLYEIVANKRNGVDVDKWDYFARDCHMTGIKSSFDHVRCIEFARVIDVDGESQICTRDKEAENLYEMFHVRWRLHQRALQHRVKNVIDAMIVDAMEKFNEHWTFKGKKMKMSAAIHDMEAYCQLTDNVFSEILQYAGDEEKVKEARNILNDVLCRKFYRFVCEARLNPDQKLDKKGISDMKKDITKKINEPTLTNDSFHILPANLDYGFGNVNPLDKVRFYKKNNPKVAISIPKKKVSWMLPEKFAEQRLRLHVKVDDEDTVTKIGDAFRQYCDDNYPKDDLLHV